MRRKLKILLFCYIFILATTSAVSGTELHEMIDAGPKLSILMNKAAKLEAFSKSNEDFWQAAVIYAEACKLGSTEAQYRLGMLYAFGKGVPENRAYAASLFSLASQQGHIKAYDMLETVNSKTQELPPCVVSDALPEKLPPLPAQAKEPANPTVRIDRFLKSLPRDKSWIIDLTKKISGWYGIDPKLVLSIMTVESAFDVAAQSPRSAMGLMQLIPATAERFNIKNAFDVSQNIKGGVKYLRWLLSHYRGNVELAVAAYNAGEKAVDRYFGIPPYPETIEYVKRLKRLYQRTTHSYDQKVAVPSPIVLKSLQM